MQQVVLDKLYKVSYFFWYLFILVLPFGTRLIIQPRIIGGIFVEWGTVSIFLSEIVLLLYCFIVLLLTLFDWSNVKARILEYKKVLIFLAVFLALALISAINSQFFGLPRSELQVLLRGFSVFWFFRLLEVSLLFLSVIILRPNLKTTALVFSLSLIPSLVLGVFQFWGQFSPASKWLGIAEHLPAVLGTSVIGLESGRFLRAYGTFAHPNIFAAFLVVNFWAVIYLVWENKNKFQKIILLPLFFLNFYCLFLTFSRAAYLALFLGFLVLSFFGLKKLKIQKGLLALFVGILVFVLILSWLHRDLITSRFAADSYLEVKSVSERVAGLGEAKQIIFKNFIFGTGPGAYTYALAEEFPNLPPHSLQPVHNIWLLILSEIGIFGFLAFVVFLSLLLKRINVNSRCKLAVVLSLFILSFFDHYLWSLWPAVSLAAIVPCLLGRQED